MDWGPLFKYTRMLLVMSVSESQWRQLQISARVEQHQLDLSPCTSPWEIIRWLNCFEIREKASMRNRRSSLERSHKKTNILRRVPWRCQAPWMGESRDAFEEPVEGHYDRSLNSEGRHAEKWPREMDPFSILWSLCWEQWQKRNAVAKQVEEYDLYKYIIFRTLSFLCELGNGAISDSMCVVIVYMCSL